jgi:cyclase
VTSVDNDGVQCGFDMELAKFSASISKVPVVIGGGCGSMEHAIELMEVKNLSGFAIGSALHYEKLVVRQLKETMYEKYFA